ncbi:TetR/AcrR family transcriptional regulator [Conexibacter sp. SYSU D00693]|uniref:TetR/AcrR family transcriptional regulator n=1 Tax=Conexibacter sp. SYSU D00693 TaxID=2812560 RepID=UPI00196A3DC8|nr:TetR/AcrR family transcriptional regulator [Conexibacter sp. SYSU D00693]
MAREADRYEEALERARSERRARHSRDTEAETAILDAAEALLEQVALHELKVAEIIERAGISRATFYFYFTSKFAVIAAVLSRSIDEIFEAVQPWVAGDEDPPADRLLRSIEAAGRIWGEHRGVLTSISESWPADEELRALWLAVTERFIDAFTAAVEGDVARGEATVPGDVRRFVTGLFWGTERVFYIAARGVEPSLPDVDAAVEVMQRTWLHAIYGTPPA